MFLRQLLFTIQALTLRDKSGFPIEIGAFFFSRPHFFKAQRCQERCIPRQAILLLHQLPPLCSPHAGEWIKIPINQSDGLRLPRRPNPKSYRHLGTGWLTVGSYTRFLIKALLGGASQPNQLSSLKLLLKWQTKSKVNSL